MPLSPWAGAISEHSARAARMNEPILQRGDPVKCKSDRVGGGPKAGAGDWQCQACVCVKYPPPSSCLCFQRVLSVAALLLFLLRGTDRREDSSQRRGPVSFPVLRSAQDRTFFLLLLFNPSSREKPRLLRITRRSPLSYISTVTHAFSLGLT